MERTSVTWDHVAVKGTGGAILYTRMLPQEAAAWLVPELFSLALIILRGRRARGGLAHRGKQELGLANTGLP
jgi:hypothetical protein